MQRQATFQTFLNITNVRVDTSHRVAHILGAAGKPYSDGELVEQCLVETANAFILIKNVILSPFHSHVVARHPPFIDIYIL